MSLNPSLITRTCRLFWCYQCHRTVRIISSPSSDVFCPRCYGQFLHEVDLPRPRLTLGLHPLPAPYLRDSFQPILGPPAGQRGIGRSGSWVIFGRTADGPPIAPAPPEHAVPPAVHPGDYFAGPGLNELIGELTENDRPGLPPAPSAAIDAMPSVRIAAAHLAGGSQCPVCKEEFGVGEEAREMPCKHVYHSDCIVPWLRIHNSCPVCRSQLPVGAGGNGERISRENSRRNGGRDRWSTPWNPFSTLSSHFRAPPSAGSDYHRRNSREVDDGSDTANGGLQKNQRRLLAPIKS